MWSLPIAIIVFTTIIAIPLSRYMAWVMDGKYQAPKFLAWFEKRLDTGPQTWVQYTVSLLLFNIVLFVFGFVVLCLQRSWMPLNGLGRGAGADDDFPQRDFVHDEHQSPALLRGPELFELQPTVLLRLEFLSLGLGRAGSAGGHYSPAAQRHSRR